MTLTTTNHGLSPLPIETIDNDSSITCVELSGCFNDATAPLAPYATGFGHEGTDFKVVPGTPVYAMYEGTVTWTGANPDPGYRGYGKYIDIKSYTNPDLQSGFLHRYAHLLVSSVSLDDNVKKGDPIGLSGNTGTASTGAHLHVQLLPFDDSGNIVKTENHPGAPGRDGNYARVATRIRGSMNFDCFVKSCGDPPIITRYDRQLLSPRDAWAEIPVYTTTDTGSPLTQPGDTSRQTMVYGKHLGCYALLDTKTVAGVIWHQIRLWDYRTGWIQQRGNIVDPTNSTDIRRNVVWVHVQDMPVGLPQRLQASVNGSTVTLSWKAPTEGASVTGYQIRRGALVWYQAALVADTGSTATHWTDTNTPPGRTYYAVAALSGKVQGPVSDVAYVNVEGQAFATLDAQTAGASPAHVSARASSRCGAWPRAVTNYGAT